MKTPTILLAEDNAADCLLLSKAFDKLGIGETVLMVDNGEDIFDYLESIFDSADFPGLIILDAFMPVMDGLETLTALTNIDPSR